MGQLNIYHYPENPKFKNTVVTVGAFDGVHLGHLSLLERLKSIVARKGGETVLATFEPHPRIALGKDTTSLKLLNTQEEKEELVRRSGIDHMVIFPFTREFSRQDEHTFIRKYLVGYLHVSCLVIGYNHRFGHRRNGNFSSLQDYGQRYGFCVEEIGRQDLEGIAVSSTEIRSFLMQGKISEANAMLGYAYPLSGTVTRGLQIGRTLGYPTANLEVKDPFKLIPARGVYAVMAEIGERKYAAMCNIGINPTFAKNIETIEVHIMDFNEDLYSRELRIRFVERLRDEMKFDSPADLIRQMSQDRENTLKCLKNLDKTE